MDTSTSNRKQRSHSQFGFAGLVGVGFVVAVVIIGACCPSKSSPSVRQGDSPPLINDANGTLSASGSVQTDSFSVEDSRERQRRSRSLATSISTLKSNFQKARDKMIAQLKVEYGADTFQKMFIDQETGLSMGRAAFIAPPVPEDSSNPGGDRVQGPSWERFQRKIMKKIITAMQQANKGDAASTAGVPLIWATGGHSSAAGHGNLFNETYTAAMVRTVKPVFEAVGVDFVGRSYAMGGTASGPEIASCVEAVFGLDTDILTWDYGMTDGHDYLKMYYYMHRAARLPNFPALIALYSGGRGSGPRLNIMADMQKYGLAAFYTNDDKVIEVKNAVPDTLESSDVSKMPEYVKYLRCGNAFETGDPCGGLKYNTDICPVRKYKAGWHPGWRMHALYGNLQALFLVEVLAGALDELEKRGPDLDAVSLWIRGQEKTERNLFQNAPLPADASSLVSDTSGAVNVTMLFKDPNICHTARLPAETRYKGILTGKLKPSGGPDSYDMGISQVEASALKDAEFMPLVDDGSRQQCPVHLNVDYKDYFWVHSNNGWLKLVLPNDAEKRAYAPRATLKGLIAICFVPCFWGKCPRGNIIHTQFAEGMAEITVNGLAVDHELTDMNGHCQILKSKKGYIFPPNAEGKWEIKARVTEPDHYMRFSSFLLW